MNRPGCSLIPFFIPGARGVQPFLRRLVKAARIGQEIGRWYTCNAHDGGTRVYRHGMVVYRGGLTMTFSRLHIMIILGLAFFIWTLVQIFQGTLVIFEHFPLAPLQGSLYFQRD